MEREAKQKLELDKRELDTDFDAKKENIDLILQKKFNRKLERKKTEMLKGDDVDVEQELAEFRREEERKFQKALKEVDEDIEKQLREEEQRLERLKRIEIEEFEQHGKKQQDLAARRED
jgi:hypothetical protein